MGDNEMPAVVLGKDGKLYVDPTARCGICEQLLAAPGVLMDHLNRGCPGKPE